MSAAARPSSSSTETYFVAATTVTDGPTSDLIRSYRSRMSSGDTREHSLDSARLAVAAVGEKELGAARRAQVEAVDARDACFVQSRLGRAPEIELPVLNDRCAEARAKRIGDVAAHLVATRPDARPDRGRKHAAEGDDRRLQDPVNETAPADMYDRNRGSAAGRPCERYRQAVGAHRKDRQGLLFGPEPVAALAARARTCAVHERRVGLVVQREPFGVGADLGARTAAVLVDALDLVAGLAAEVERRERSLAHAADARRKDD